MPKKSGRTRWCKKKGAAKGKKIVNETADGNILEADENRVENDLQQSAETVVISDSSSQESNPPVNEVNEVLPKVEDGADLLTRPPANEDAEIIVISSDSSQKDSNLEDRSVAPQPNPPTLGGNVEVAQPQESPAEQQSRKSGDELVASPAKRARTDDSALSKPGPFILASVNHDDDLPRPSSAAKTVISAIPARRRVFGRLHPRNVDEQVAPVVREEAILDQHNVVADNPAVVDEPIDNDMQPVNVNDDERDMFQGDAPIVISDDEQNEAIIDQQPPVLDNRGDDQPQVVEAVDDPIPENIFDDDLDQAILDRIRDLEQNERLRNQDPRRRLPTYLRATRPEEAVELNIGNMSERCNHCRARYFPGEKPQRGTYNKCCGNGNVRLEPLHEHPDELKDLFTGANQDWSAEFRNKIVTYNNLLAFTSIQAERRELPGFGPYVYAIRGQMYYHYTNINVNRGNQRFGPLYILNPEDAAEQRFENGREFNVQRPLVRILSEILHRDNPYAQQYRSLYQEYERQALRAAQENVQIPRPYLEFISRRNRQLNREFDLPEANEVAAIYRHDDDERPNPNRRAFPRVFVQDEDDRGLQTIPIYSEHSDPLAYPLLFPFGDLGWNENIPLQRPVEGGRRKVSLLEYYAYRLADRHEDGEFDIFRHAGRLNQHFIVGAYLKIENDRLDYIRRNQDRLRADHYQGLIDYLNDRAERDNIPIGRRIILPSSHQGSPRHQLQRFQDAMAVANAVGNPTFFITMTCNPNWPEIRAQIPANDQAVNHPLVVARVFKEKLRELMKEIKNKHVFGVVKAYQCVIEFQKRGLPHAHILITVENADRLQDAASVDRFVCAEIPDPDREPELYRLVGQHHIHGPCGELDPNSVCMVDDICNKKFPMYFYNQTTIREGSINYRRRRNGRRIQVTRRRRVFEVGNEFVVPYNKYLLLRFRAHINIEVVTGQMHYKYLFKYFFKNPDQVLIQVGDGEIRQLNYNEVDSYISGLYTTAPEAAWRILKFEMYDCSHTTVRLPVHLPDRQNVVFRQGEEQERVDQVGHTELTHWFEMNRTNPEARQHRYPDFPLRYTWHPRTKTWAPRRRANKPIVSRMYTVSLKYGELYYLRVLLLHVRGATSFEDLRTVNGQVLPTFREACDARGLIQEDQEWRRCLQEAAGQEMPRRIRQMFAFILVYGTVTNAPDLWTNFRNAMIDDFVHFQHLEERDAEIRALEHIQRILVHNGRRLNEFGLEEPEEIGHINAVDDPVDVQVERQVGDQMIENLNAEQRAIFDRVMTAVDDQDEPNRLFYVSGAAGTGKTYLYNSLISHLNGREQKVISIAWTGLAAALLKNGRTIHNRFQLPVPLLEDSTSGITGQSEAAAFLREAKLVIWDEVSMATRISMGIVDKTLRDLCGIDRPFGGKCVVVGGDFKQCLPVVPGGDRASILNACVKTSRLWPLFEHIRLETNVRVREEEVQFIQWLDRLGSGTLPTIRYGTHNNIVQVPDQCVVPTLDALIARVFGEITPANVQNAAILTPLNETCNQINDRIVASIQNARERLYLSADSVVTDDPDLAEAFPVENLNNLTPSGIPPHRLLLKEGIVVMLLRNLNVRQNLCNGTRMIIRYLGINYIRAEVINFDGTLSGNEVCIPRIDLISQGNVLPITLRRRQFPVRPCYAMTINKAQGQTFDKVGIHLPSPVFEHGQLYVAFSRARTVDNVTICVEETALQGKLLAGQQTTCTKNIVYREVLRQD